MLNFTYSAQGIALTEKFEADGGPKLVAYADTLAHGKPTVGWGHTGSDVHVGDTWTYEECVAALHSDIHWAENLVNRLITYPINQSEFDALVDIFFNVGPEQMSKSTLVEDINLGLLQKAAAQFDLWDHASGKVVAGLLRRRQAETDEFERGMQEPGEA